MMKLSYDQCSSGHQRHHPISIGYKIDEMFLVQIVKITADVATYSVVERILSTSTCPRYANSLILIMDVMNIYSDSKLFSLSEHVKSSSWCGYATYLQ